MKVLIDFTLQTETVFLHFTQSSRMLRYQKYAICNCLFRTGNYIE